MKREGKNFRAHLLICVLAVGVAWPASAAGPTPQRRTSAADQALARYFEAETAALEMRCLATNSVSQWQGKRDQYRGQLEEMLGLNPMPERTDLKPVITGRVEHDDFLVEKLYFQSSPGLYVTANLYRPKRQEAPAPTILYLSGHGPVIKNGISYGNKVAYQHHGAWFARNGYVCLIIDTVELGEIQGIHHGTYSERMWWWNSRGYTPAGVEAWNSIRALDYLSTRPEVDTNSFGVTGRSGGGAYSWWVAALDDRIKVAAAVAGITDLRNHVVDGTVEGHCDCMFTVNTYRWDYPQVAALVAPRPLMIANSDRDTIFPLNGLFRLHQKVRNVYESYGAATNLALLITDGPHKDTQDLQLPVFRWFNRHLKHSDPLIEMAAVKFFEPEQLKVFERLPQDAVNKTVQQTFVPAAASLLESNPESWQAQSSNWLKQLQTKCFAAWPVPTPIQPRTRFSAERDHLLFRAIDFFSQPNVPLRLYVLGSIEHAQPRRIVLNVLDSGTNQPTTSGRPEAVLQWHELLQFMNTEFPDMTFEEPISGQTNTRAGHIDLVALTKWILTNHAAVAFMAPRGMGLNSWDGDEKRQTQIRRRFMLLGETLDSMRVWDIRRGVQALRVLHSTNAPISLEAQGSMAVNTLYASLFEPIASLQLWNLPTSQMQGPDYLNVIRVVDIPQVLSLALNRQPVHLHGVTPGDWQPIVEFAKQSPRIAKGARTPWFSVSE